MWYHYCIPFIFFGVFTVTVSYLRDILYLTLIIIITATLPLPFPTHVSTSPFTHLSDTKGTKVQQRHEMHVHDSASSALGAKHLIFLRVRNRAVLVILQRDYVMMEAAEIVLCVP